MQPLEVFIIILGIIAFGICSAYALEPWMNGDTNRMSDDWKQERYSKHLRRELEDREMV